MPAAKAIASIAVLLAALLMGGCVAAYVGGKAVGAAVDVTTGTVGLAAKGTVATARGVTGLITGGDDECDDRDDEETCEGEN